MMYPRGNHPDVVHLAVLPMSVVVMLLLGSLVEYLAFHHFDAERHSLFFSFQVMLL